MAQLQQRSMEAAIAEEDPELDPTTNGGSSAPSSVATPAAADRTDGMPADPTDPTGLDALELASARDDTAAFDPLSNADDGSAVSPPDLSAQPMAMPPSSAQPSPAQPVAVPPRLSAPPDAAPRPSPADSSGRGPSGSGGFSWPQFGREYGGSMPLLLRRQSGSAMMASNQSQVNCPLLISSTDSVVALPLSSQPGYPAHIP